MLSLSQGTWMNLRGGNENNLPFKVPHIFEFLSMIVNLRSPTQFIDHLIGGTIRLLIEDDRIQLVRGVRTISIDIGTPEEFAQLQEGCIRALEVLLLLQLTAEEKIGSISATLSLAPAPAVGLSMLSTTFTVVLNMLGGCPAARMGFQELHLIPGRHHHHM